jgi:hypothetical protein
MTWQQQPWQQPPEQPQQPAYYPPQQQQYDQYQQQPQYPPYQQYAQPQYPPFQPPRKKGHGLLIGLLLGGGGLVVLVLEVIGILVGPTIIGTSADTKTTISTPDKAGGLAKDTADSQADTLSDSGLKDTVSAVYKNADGSQQVFLLGGKTTIYAISTNIDAYFSGLGKAGATISERKSYDDGSLDGQLECAKATTTSVTAASCVWVNHGGLVATLADDQTPDAMAKTTQAMLPDVVKIG